VRRRASGRDVSGALKNPSDKRRMTVVESYLGAGLSDGFAFERVSAAFFATILPPPPLSLSVSIMSLFSFFLLRNVRRCLELRRVGKHLPCLIAARGLACTSRIRARQLNLSKRGEKKEGKEEVSHRAPGKWRGGLFRLDKPDDNRLASLNDHLIK